MAVELSVLLDNLDVVGLDINFPTTITGFTNDSRLLKRGDIFVAVAGTELAGSDYLPEAQQKGAIGAIVDDSLIVPAGVTIPILRVGNAREALSFIAREFYGNPSEKLLVDAFIGTKGKTTSTYMAQSVCAAGFGANRTGVIGTLGAHGGGVDETTGLTTPESVNLQRILAQFVKRDVVQVSVEYTAHAIVLRRGMHVKFASGVFVSFSQDHLDFFGNMDDYLEAKVAFFRERADDENFRAVVNIDEPVAAVFLEAMGEDAITFGMGERGDLRAENVRVDKGLTSFDLAYDGSRVSLSLDVVGRYNVSNALAAAGLGIRHGIGLEKIAKGLMDFTPVPGRMESIREGQAFEVLVDYAHSPESVRVVLEAISGLGFKRKIAVMGAGGDRDRSKRPIIGRELMSAADVVIVTSDNPRSEDPSSIIEAILAGVREVSGGEHFAEPDRAKAIRMALEGACEGDVVMILGKGAEDYQEIAGVRHPFDDREVCRAILREMLDSCR